MLNILCCFFHAESCNCCAEFRVKRRQAHRREWTAAKREFDEQALGGFYCSFSRRWGLRSLRDVKEPPSRRFYADARRVNRKNAVHVENGNGRGEKWDGYNDAELEKDLRV